MAYSDFAYWYDDLNEGADYDALAEFAAARLQAAGITSGIVADLGCGTGEISLRFAAAGYDLIAIDASEDMLDVFQDKMDAFPQSESILLLHQKLEELDLYGTIRAAVAFFDTLNHLPHMALEEALRRVSLFMEPGGVFLFDVNTPYKHEHILANNTFTYSWPDEGVALLWKNQYDAELQATHIRLECKENGEIAFCESFYEYVYPIETLVTLLENAGFTDVQVCDGDDYGELRPESQRAFFSASRK